jgi:hypothetical protein
VVLDRGREAAQDLPGRRCQQPVEERDAHAATRGAGTEEREPTLW